MEGEIALAPSENATFKLTFPEKIQIGKLKWIEDQEHKTIDQASEASLTSLYQQIEALVTKSDQELSVSKLSQFLWPYETQIGLFEPHFTRFT